MDSPSPRAHDGSEPPRLSKPIVDPAAQGTQFKVARLHAVDMSVEHREVGRWKSDAASSPMHTGILMSAGPVRPG